MRFSSLITAAALAFAGVAGTGTAASAATVPVAGASTLAVSAAAVASPQDRRYHRDRRHWNRDRRHWNRHHRRWYRHRYHRPTRVCWRTWRHGHRVRVCRWRR